MNSMIKKAELSLPWRMRRDFDRLFGPFDFDRFLQPTEFAWTPDLEVFESGNELVVKADVPGLKREDLKVEITDAELTISGERKIEREDKTKNRYRSERSYGNFFRSVLLPEGINPELAKATVKDGVLEVKMPMAKIEAKKRRLEIHEEALAEKSTKHAA